MIKMKIIFRKSKWMIQTKFPKKLYHKDSIMIIQEMITNIIIQQIIYIAQHMMIVKV